MVLEGFSSRVVAATRDGDFFLRDVDVRLI